MFDRFSYLNELLLSPLHPFFTVELILERLESESVAEDANYEMSDDCTGNLGKSYRPSVT
jgi:hypothetical protein